MARYKIIQAGDPVLRTPAVPVTVFHKKLAKLVDDMYDILYSKDGGAGLAAPQIGISKRIVVIDCGDGPAELINPEILSKEGEQTGEEGCLSVRGYYGIVKRADIVRVKAFDRKGNEFEIEAEGFTARCIQHEVDHLNGILYTDRVEQGSLFTAEGSEADVRSIREISGKPGSNLD